MEHNIEIIRQNRLLLVCCSRREGWLEKFPYHERMNRLLSDKAGLPDSVWLVGQALK